MPWRSELYSARHRIRDRIHRPLERRGADLAPARGLSVDRDRGVRPAAPAAAPRGRGASRLAGRRAGAVRGRLLGRSDEHTSELQSLMRISYDVFCLKITKHKTTRYTPQNTEYIPHKQKHEQI